MDAVLTPQAFRNLLAGPAPVTLVDVRRADAFACDPVLMPGAVRRPPEDVLAWGPALPTWRPVVVYCAHGRDVGRDVAQTLRALGLQACCLAGGLDAWRESGGAVAPQRAPTRWVTRERPKIDRIACPWFIWRFVDADAVVDYVPANEVLAHAAATGATPFDVPDVAYSHAGERCSFDAFVARHARGDGALEALADIVRAADTNRPGDAPQAAGLLAVSLGLARLIASDHALLHHALLVYDALYAWCRDAREERHGWDPAGLRNAA
ncbi:MAG TPA: chromate resistance protein ChrB domain-containing protein [Casimicrobiaceae bacterium]|nr:chromate resistance protein ChrB domain-containing protein [Casimicrobiaceae bacterium]